MAQIIGIGDSIMQGVGASNLGWFDLLKKDLHQSMFGVGGAGEIHSVFNLGIAGNTTRMILERLEDEIKARVNPSYETVFIFSAGLNDSKAIDAPNNFVSSLELYAKNLQKIIGILRQHTPKIIILGLSTFDENKTTPKGTGSYFTLNRSEDFNETMRKIAKKSNIPFVDIYGSMLSNDYSKLLYLDGLHPNDVGHEWIAEQIKPALYKLLDL